MENHGSWKVARLSDQIIISRIKGTFSRESIEKYCTRLIELAKQFEGKPWIHICDARDFELGVPDAMPIALKTNDWALKHNRILRVFCTSNQLQEHLLNQIASDNTYYVNSIEEMLNHLEENKYDINRSDILHWFKLAERG